MDQEKGHDMRISDVFTMGCDFGYGDGGYRGYGDFNRYCYRGVRPFRAPIQVKAPDLYGKDGKGAY